MLESHMFLLDRALIGLIWSVRRQHLSLLLMTTTTRPISAQSPSQRGAWQMTCSLLAHLPMQAGELVGRMWVGVEMCQSLLLLLLNLALSGSAVHYLALLHLVELHIKSLQR
jgi:hypothetical protein